MKIFSRSAWKALASSLCLPGIILSSCQKTPELSSNLPTNENIPAFSANQAAKIIPEDMYEKNTMTWDDLVKGYSDTDSRRRHAQMFLSLGLTEVVKNPSIVAWIINEAPKHEDSVFFMERLFQTFPEAKKIIEATEDPLGKMTGWTFEKVQEEMQYDEYDIKASIYLASLPNVDNSIQPIVTPGGDLFHDSAKGVDIVLGVLWDTNGVITRINLYEELARTTQAPVFTVEGRAKNIKELINRPMKPEYQLYSSNQKQPPIQDGPPVNNGAVITSDYADHRMAITKYQIGYRYENSGNSELHITGRMAYTPIYNSGSGSSTRAFLRDNGSNGCGGTTTDDYELASVPASYAQNWTVVPINKFFAWIYDPFPSNPSFGEYDHNFSGSVHQPRKVLFFNTYENDGWPSSFKPLSPTSVNGVYLDLKGRMGNHNEWYQFDPTAGTTVWWNTYAVRINLAMTNPSWVWGLWTEPVKGMLEFRGVPCN